VSHFQPRTHIMNFGSISSPIHHRHNALRFGKESRLLVPHFHLAPIALLTPYERPSFKLSLMRTPHLPPDVAQFVVPLSINKLDLRDYLHNAYNIEVLNVRSFITQQRIERHKPGFQTSRYYRPKSIKKMTVQLLKPFLYPEEPQDLSPYATPCTSSSGVLVAARSDWLI